MTEPPEWRISTAALVKILLTALLVLVAIYLWPLVILLAMAVLLAVTLHPVSDALQRRGLPHWAAMTLITTAIAAGFVVFVTLLLPVLTEQLSGILHKIPELQKTVVDSIPAGAAQRALKRLFSDPGLSASHVLTAGQMVLGALLEVVLVVILALYLVSDGRRTYRWLLAFFSERHRDKINRTAEEAARIIFAYVAGQVITSVLCAIYAFTVLKLLDVPAALVLAVLAGIFDILPMLGFFLFIIPAVLVALAVSGATALWLFGAYTAYHLFENYFLVPKIYGNRLRLSDLVVLVSVLAGGMLAGIPGAILILPLVAIYPAVERIWLIEYIGPRVVAKHQATAESPPS